MPTSSSDTPTDGLPAGTLPAETGPAAKILVALRDAGYLADHLTDQEAGEARDQCWLLIQERLKFSRDVYLLMIALEAHGDNAVCDVTWDGSGPEDVVLTRADGKVSVRRADALASIRATLDGVFAEA